MKTPRVGAEFPSTFLVRGQVSSRLWKEPLGGSECVPHSSFLHQVPDAACWGGVGTQRQRDIERERGGDRGRAHMLITLLDRATTKTLGLGEGRRLVEGRIVGP